MEESVKHSEILLEPWKDTLDLDDTEVRRNFMLSIVSSMKKKGGGKGKQK